MHQHIQKLNKKTREDLVNYLYIAIYWCIDSFTCVQLTMRYLVGIICALVCVIVLFPVFATSNQLVIDFCALQKDMSCPTNFSAEVAPIEKKFITYKQSLQKKPIALVAAQVQRAIQMSQQTQWSKTEELKTRYLRRRLEQRQREIREKMETISISPKVIRSLRSTHVHDAQFLHALRQRIIPGLVASWFSRFATKPYGDSQWIYVDTWWQVTVNQIFLKDDLDAYLLRRWNANKKLTTNEISLYLTPKDKDALWFVYLFKNKEDLDKLWYTLVSNRERVNTDEGYRRFNIQTAFTHIWPVRVINPGESISFLTESHFDMDEQKLYKWWKAIASDEEIDDYGGWLCGAATAIYQWAVTNSAFNITMRNHTKRYKNLYTATIDGERHALPGIDATIYSPNLDMVLTNTKTYPLVISMNYDGTYKWLESVFTLWKSDDRWSLEYIWKRFYTATMNVKWWGTTSVTWQCHSWYINGKKQERCYKEIK